MLINQRSVVKVIRRSLSSYQLVCFPYVGGSWMSFREVTSRLPGDIEILAINPPGHMDDGELLTSIEQMADVYLSALEPYFKSNVIFFGYSLGSLVAYQILKKISVDQNFKNRFSLIVSASVPPHLISTVNKVCMNDDNQFIGFFNSLGGMPTSLTEDSELMKYYFPILKTDYLAFENYSSAIEKLNVEGYILCGSHDHFSPLEKMEGWKEYFQQLPSLTVVEGKHMFVLENPNDTSFTLMQILNSFMGKKNFEKTATY